jgi:N-acetyl-gamma-glutamyl-phosphate reductase
MSAEPVRVGIVGVSGYSGVELARLLARHPRFSLKLVTTDRWAGKRLGQKVAVSGDAAALECQPQAAGQARFGELDLVFLATPAEASIEIAPKALVAGARVVDLSGAFRLPASDYPAWYGFTHPDPILIEQAVYSMPEATGVAGLREARLVSNPGCYATAATLAVLPLLRAGLVDPGTLVVDAKSGTTGAGRKANEEMSFSEVADDFRAYRILKHQHTPEIERTLSLAGVPGARVTFTTHLLPVRRGILATAYGRLAGVAGDATAAAVKAFESFAEGKPFLQVVPPEEVTLHASLGTNRVVLGAKADVSRGVVVSFASLDNLVKGAAGQAGLPETTGLLDSAGHAP